MIISPILGLAVALAAAAAPLSEVDTARASVVGSDILSATMVDYCRQAAPARATAIDTAWRKWRAVSQVEAIRSALGANAVARTETAFAAQKVSIRQKMEGLGNADAVCAQLPATWSDASFDMRANYPKAYPVSATQAAAPAPAKPVTKLAQGKALGKSLAAAQIETIVSSFYEGYVGTQFTLTETNYLVLKDGTVRSGLPNVGPGDFDVAADRAQFPNKWGQWQKSAGGYVFRFAGDKSFAAPRGASVRGPAKPGLKLDNHYQTASGYQIIGGAGSFNFSNLTLRGDGRFTRSNHGFTGGTVGVGGNAVTAGTTWDDKGSVTTVTGEGAAMRGGGTTRNGTTDADLQGTYRINGYELELLFESGRRESHFFFVSTDQRMIGLDDGTMIVRKP